jgi:outer membrane protein OmpA-like peptidoglycan-associated protein
MTIQYSKTNSKPHLVKVIVVSASLALTACQTVDPNTGETKTNNALKGAAIGALVCGAIGATENSKHARNAALGCGVIGAGIGAYMDKQEQELRESLAETGVGVEREGDNINLIMPGNITFATAKANIQQDFYPILNSVATVLGNYKETAIEIEGHTDSVGSMSFNLELSEKRAQSVSSYLVSKGIAQQRVIHFGKGPMRPIASNQTEVGRAQNRRVEIRIRAIAQ